MSHYLVQIFLSNSAGSPGPGIFEVSTTDDYKLDCTCPGFVAKSSCKHVRLVEKRIKDNGGTYPWEFFSKIPVEELEAAMESDELYRAMIIKHGKIEVY